MPFVSFELERWQSTWENRVRYNLSESGVHPLSIKELLDLAGASPAPLLDVRLGYSQSNGTDLLRRRIAALYDGVSPEQILVTTGSAEANFVVCWRLVEPGDKVAVMLPNYLQTWGLAQNFGAEVRGFTLRSEAQWEPAHGAAAHFAGHESEGLAAVSQRSYRLDNTVIGTHQFVVVGEVVGPIRRHHGLDLGGVLGELPELYPQRSTQPLHPDVVRRLLAAVLAHGVTVGAKDQLDGVDQGAVEVEQER